MTSLLTQPAKKDVRLLLTTREAAKALGICERLLGDLTRAGEIPCLRLPGRGKARSIRYHVADLEAWINRTKTEQAADSGKKNEKVGANSETEA